ncbi:serine/threonine-protein kinase [Streptomyces sp. SID3343]|uniref:serine/threonine-protein kinase n=1 Tax=Streptomyces sp. SID3343 TaxID=2690260 RepID=UPI001370D3E3|nr:serine/threonine-protein kinase [Streptomyces sp. SID3343]MYV97673.1 protein kinase [Streptomyces sp. SID3343]
MNGGIPGRRVIDGRFELLDRLGGGGMGLVWRARDLALHREVALKEVRPPDPALLEDDPTAAQMLRERVLREARSLARLNHPNVVTIHHIVDAAEVPHPWLVMELVPGGSLHDRLALGPVPPAEAARIGLGVLSALVAAHAAGIQHRDVKPGNVLLRDDGSPVLTDFGIAALRESTNLTATGELIGSPEYIAPERIRGEEDNAASDLWSLGMMLYVAVEGQHPLRRATSLATLAAVLTDSVPPPVRAGALGPVLAALLVRDPAARPDATHLERLLTAVAEAGEAGGGRPSAQHTTSSLPITDVPSWPSWSAADHGADATPGRGTGGEAGPGTGAGSATGGWATGGSATSGSRGAGGRPPSNGRSVGDPSADPYHPAPPESAAQRRAGQARIIVGSLVGVCVVGVLAAFSVKALLHDSDAGDTASARQGSETPGRTPSAGKTTEPFALPSEFRVPTSAPTSTRPKEDLLTPAGARSMVESMKPVIKGTNVKRLVIYPEYASIDAPTPDNAKLKNSFSYRNGATTQDSPRGSTDRDTKTIDVTKINWDALPTLLAKADKDLGIAKPTGHYVSIDLGLIDRVPSISVYVTDDYGGAYLRADLDGKVTKTYPRD